MITLTDCMNKISDQASQYLESPTQEQILEVSYALLDHCREFSVKDLSDVLDVFDIDSAFRAAGY